MNDKAADIRCSEAADLTAIRAVHRDAFGSAEGKEIADLVSSLLKDETAQPLLSLVAEIDADIVGHVLFTAVRIPGTRETVPARILAPLGVSPSRQRSGIGGALVRAGLRRLRTDGVGLVFVLGHPGYYPRFGFRPAGALGLTAPYPIAPEHQDAWMVLELKPGLIGDLRGKIACARSLDRPEYW